MIYASGMPFSVFVVASILSVFYRIPWIAEFRDLYVDDHYYPYPRWRRELDSRLERRLISRAIGLVTVSQPLADVLRKKYDKPTEVVLNGFVPDDLPRQAPGSSSDTRVLRIVYTGTLTGLMYELRRDPTPLFQALRFIGALAAYVKVAYYGRDGEILRDIARREGVENYVESYGVISYKEALAVQAQADILLLLLWNSPEERGVYTGKLFEYLGARKPILAIGPSDNVATCLIRERGAGIVAIDPEHIADYLRSWISQKRASGVIPPLPPRVMEGLTRKEQTKRLERFLDNTLAQIE